MWFEIAALFGSPWQWLPSYDKQKLQTFDAYFVTWGFTSIILRVFIKEPS